ncbi:MAG: toll/interleukin-1 receptor domain-containing protein [Planctomycetota bacterium]
MKTFVSFSSADRPVAERFVELLRLHYIDFFYSHRTLKGGYFAEDIANAIRECQKFIVLVSPNSLASEWVRKEVAMAMNSPHLRGRVLPVLIAETPGWEQLHADIHKLQKFDYYRDPAEVETRIIEQEFNRPRHKHPYYKVGDVEIQVLMFVGGDGVTRFDHGDIVCDGPTDARRYVVPPDIQQDAERRIAQITADCNARGKMFVNNPQVRLWDATWGGASASGGLTNKPLRLKLGWTEYFHTRLTNQERHYVLPDGQSIALKYGRELDDLLDSGLSNPIATNMSVVTSDNMIYLSTRSKKVAWNAGEFQPAVGGDGQREDLDETGRYDPFRTAIREAQEECTGRYRPSLEEVVFFGLARTMGTQFPFLFGELRLKIDSTELDALVPLNPFEGQKFKIPFSVDGVCDWVLQYHRDHFEGRRGGVIGTTLFSLLQSLHYAYPDRWGEVVKRLSRS